ncbi:MAG: M23 family metallopeptidase [Planctomycetota bacterium]|nr:M23 family metallopeptidase [Planctomycetota bacterium]
MAPSILRVLGVLLLLLAPFAAQADETDAQAATKLVFVGRAEIERVRSLGEQDFRFWLEVGNPTDAKITIEAANLLCVHRGGWLTPLDPDPMDGSFFRGTWAVPPSGKERHEVGSWIHRVPTPAMHCLLSVRVADGGANLVVPITFEEKEAPAAYTPAPPFAVGVIGPLKAVPFSDGRTSIVLVGQHQVLDGPDPEDVETSVFVSTDQGATDPVRWEGLEAEGDAIALWPFVRRVDVISEFTKGLLRLDAKATTKKQHTFSKTWSVTRAEPVVLLSPVLGAWQLTNGPGQPNAHAHALRPDHLFAYDMVVVEDGRTHRGDPHKNASYFAWERSIRAVADGVVVDVCDRESDNPGYRGSTTDCVNNRVVLRHDDGLYTAYMHIRQRSAPQPIVIGKRVKAGQVIAKVGNSGKSSEPHLHFQAFRLDATGRLEAVPVTFSNASHDEANQDKLEGVPVGGSVVHFHR